ncbi:response regulator transcription factor [Lysinibacillus sphaericus]|uniref:response regulator transcription factor n=1 Tax=Lysinibacillus sphaericus TaxID=1421 RepID=UPI002163C12F|nr:response regulator transcription factor [Lysinibacillus sphaericus]MCS1384054.1 response regulator transcription factor [Lysinibacillus sphaericus]
MISVLVVDDHPIVLKGLKTLSLEIEDLNFEIEKNPHKVLDRMQEEEFHVYLIDACIATNNNLELTTEIKAQQEQAIIILYTTDGVCSYYPLLVEKKVEGILVKTAPIDQIISTIRLSFQEKIVIPTDFIDYVNEKINDRYANLKLTHRELKLLQMLMNGYPNKKIAAICNVSIRTVERHLTQLFSLLGVSTRLEAVEIAKEKQLLNEMKDN